MYAPISYILPSHLKKYEALYDTRVEGGKSRFKQVDRERSLQALMTTNLLKRLESSVESFRLTLGSLQKSHRDALEKIATFKQTGAAGEFADVTAAFADADLDDADFDDNHLPLPGDSSIGKEIQFNRKVALNARLREIQAEQARLA